MAMSDVLHVLLFKSGDEVNLKHFYCVLRNTYGNYYNSLYFLVRY